MHFRNGHNTAYIYIIRKLLRDPYIYCMATQFYSKIHILDYTGFILYFTVYLKGM